MRLLLESLFVKGLLVGFCLAAPVGPIAVLCIQRTMAHGRTAGLVSGLGAAVADAIYGAAAAFGVTFISKFLFAHEALLQRIGGVILCLMGLRLLLAKPPRGDRKADDRGFVGDFVSTLALTLTNPMTFVAFAAIFATIHVGAIRGHSVLTVELVAGVLLGSALWWAIVVLGVYTIRRHFTFSALTWINRSAGVFVIGVGILYLTALRAEPGRPPRLPIPRRRTHAIKEPVALRAPITGRGAAGPALPAEG